MKIGLAFDLRSVYLAMGLSPERTAEFDREETVETIEAALNRLGFETERIGHAYALARALDSGRRWDMVFNIAEGLSGYGRESLVPALLDAHHVPYVFSDPLAMALTLHKGMAKRVVRDLGLATPDFAVVQDMRDVRDVRLPYPLFAKPVAEGTGKGVTPASMVENPQALAEACARLLAEHDQPVLVETYLPGREFTVGVVGTDRDARVVGSMEVVLSDKAEAGAYTYTNKEECEELVTYVPTRDQASRASEALALAAYKGLGIRDAGRVDVRLDASGAPSFMEVNPLPGLHPEHSDLPILCTLNGVSFDRLISDIMASALSRPRPAAPLGFSPLDPTRTREREAAPCA